jgi:hypothetical protein
MAYFGHLGVGPNADPTTTERLTKAGTNSKAASPSSVPINWAESAFSGQPSHCKNALFNVQVIW